MTDSREPLVPAAVPVAAVERRRRLPLVWIIPLVAAAIGAWLAYTTWSKQGPTITIVFESASGIEPGKTPVKFRDVAVGLVKTVVLSDDLSHVMVTAQMDKSTTDHLLDGTQFWIENARVTASGISGLGTLISGAYIGVLPGSGKPTRVFTGIEQPPVLQVTVPGHKFTLRAERLGSISSGAPLYFRGIQVGEVLGSKLDASGKNVSIFAFVRSPYDGMVRPQTHFWNASGVDMSVGASGLKVRTESMVAILVGGIAFDTPVGASGGEPSPDGAEFQLFTSYGDIQEAQYTESVPFILYFQGSVSGLKAGAPVTCRGMQIGLVRSVSLEIDIEARTARIPVQIELQPQRVTLLGRGNVIDPAARMEAFVARGLRGQLRSTSLLTGDLEVALDWFPNSPPAQVIQEGGISVIPTVPSEIEQFTRKASVFLDKLADAPLPELVSDLRRTVQNVDALLTSKSLHRGIDGLGPMVEDLQKAADAARATLVQAETTLKSANGVIGRDAALRYDLVRMVNQLTDAARSLRTLADYLERNPNALIFGNTGDH
ncbi:MAG: MlaD family protein [bacterium]